MSFVNAQGQRRSSRSATHAPPDPAPAYVESTHHSSTTPPTVTSPKPSKGNSPTPLRRSSSVPTSSSTLALPSPLQHTRHPSPPAADGTSTASLDGDSDLSYHSQFESVPPTVRRLAYQPNRQPSHDSSSRNSQASRSSIIARIEHLEGRSNTSPPLSSRSNLTGTRSREPPTSPTASPRMQALQRALDQHMQAVDERFHTFRRDQNQALQETTAQLTNLIRQGIRRLDQSLEAKVTEALPSHNPPPRSPTEPSPCPPSPPSTASPARSPPAPTVPTPPRAPDPPSAHTTPTQPRKHQSFHRKDPEEIRSSPVRNPYAKPSSTPVRNPYNTSKKSSVKPNIIRDASKPPTDSPRATTVKSPNLSSRHHQPVYVAADKDHHILKFPVFNPKGASYRRFESLCMLEAKSYPYSDNLVVRDPINGTLEFNTGMTVDESELVFTATIKAFKEKVNEVIGNLDTYPTNGFQLWQDLDNHYLQADKSTLEIKGLKAEFEAISINNNETYDQYLLRFENKAYELSKVGTPFGSAHDLGLHFILSLKRPALFKSLITKVNNDKDYFVARSMRAFLKEIKQHHSVELAIDPTISKANLEPAAKFSQNSNQNQDNNRHTSSTTSSSSSSNPNANPYRPRNHFGSQDGFTEVRSNIDTAARRVFKDHLAASANKVQFILSQFQQHTERCPLHGGLRHPLVECRALEPVCREADCSGFLRKAKWEYNNGNRNRNEPSAGAPHTRAPTPAPAAAPTTAPSDSARLASVMVALDAFTARFDKIEENLQAFGEASEMEPGTDESNINNNTPSLPYVAFPNNSVHDFHAKNIIDHAKYVPMQGQTNVHSADSNNHRLVIDSGATCHMSHDPSMFESIEYFNEDDAPVVMMGDDKTLLIIAGLGYMSYQIGTKKIRHQGYYIPLLGTTLYSVKQHMRSLGCYFLGSAQETHLAFPTFIITPRVDHEIDMVVTPFHSKDEEDTFDFDESTSPQVPINQEQSNDRSIQKSKSSQLLSGAIKKYIPDRSQHKNFVQEVQINQILPNSNICPSSKNKSTFIIHSPTTFSILPHQSKVLPSGLNIQLPSSITIQSVPNNSNNIVSHATPIDIHKSIKGIQLNIKNNTDKIVTVRAGTPIAYISFKSGTSSCYHYNPTSYQPNTSSDHTQASSSGSKSMKPPSSQTIAKWARVRRASKLNLHTHAIHTLQSPPKPKSRHRVSKLPSISEEITSHPAPSKVHSSLPKRLSLPHDTLLQSIGFRRPEALLSNIKTIGLPTVIIQKDKNPELPLGATATLKAARRNTHPTELYPHYNEVWNIDIGYGPTVGIGGVKYTLMCIDRATKMRKIYGLKNLKGSLLEAMQQFILDCGSPPRRLRTDFDSKLFGGRIGKLLKKHNIDIKSAPPYRQHQNGLLERHWQSAVDMARNWMRHSLLPAKYWFFALKRACEICNILPTKHHGSITTSHELVYKQKVDYRCLFPLFSVAYIKKYTNKGKAKNKWESHSLKCIVVGKCPKSDGLLFFHPPSKQTFTSATYKFDTFLPAGPQFNEKYDGTFVMTTLQDMENVHLLPTHQQGATVYVKSTSGIHQEAKILSIPLNEDTEPYVIQELMSGSIYEAMKENLLQYNPTEQPTNNTAQDFPHLPWLKTNAKVTLYLNDRMKEPKQGILTRQHEEWYFHQGRSKRANPMHLPNFLESAESLLHNKKLFQGWITRQRALSARVARATSNMLANLIYCRHVSAQDLIDMSTPASLLKHHLMHPSDKKIWDASYRSEYEGLVNIDTWELISQADYENLKTSVKGIMPTMAISVIKYDGNGRPVRAKYRIVALGNLDPHNWEKQDCFAPVLSQMELRFIVALAVKLRCIPKTGDIKQAFCQSLLPCDEKYICSPPPGCPLTPPNSYLKLKKTLYGLKRSPRHFYNLLSKLLKELGLQQHPTSPCIFSGQILANQPPIYIGIYVDDIIYFSPSREVETAFEERLKEKIDIEFNGQIGYFLGINFTCVKSPDNNITIHLSQEAFIESIASLANLKDPHMNYPKTPYRSGFPVDKIDSINGEHENQAERTKQMQQLVGCLNWLSISTRPDISTITNILSKFTSKPTQQHLDHTKYVIKYLLGTKDMGITYTSTHNSPLESYIKFPINPETVTSLCDANWGPQDASVPKGGSSQQLELFKTRSISGFLHWFMGPIHWTSKRQTITARSSAEAEIYATDECIKSLQHLSYLIDGLNLKDDIMPAPTKVYNDNSACIQWSVNLTTKGLRHLQIRENAVRESVQSGFATVQHIAGKCNLSDMFTKEDKDISHFLTIRDLILCSKAMLQVGFHVRSSASVSQTLGHIEGGVKLGNAIPADLPPSVA